MLPFEMRVPVPPVPVRAGGKTRLDYELHVTNLDPKGRELEITALDVLAEGRETPLLHLDGGALDAVLTRPGLPDVKDKRKLGGGLRAVAFLWIDLDGPAPAVLLHRLTIHGPSGDKSVDGGRAVVPAGAPLVLGPPLRGGRWVALNGPSKTSVVHRLSMQVVDGLPRISQRFAIDWMKLGDDGLAFHGDSKKNESWAGYGSEVLAVADGTVASVKDGIPQNTPLSPEMAVPITLDTIGGNFVILDLGDGRYAFSAHLQPGSLRVKPGDRVRRGQVLGLLGNSGNSDVPHLHFHLADANNSLGAEGLPYVFAEFWVQGAVESAEDVVVGKAWKPAGTEERRTGEIPLENAVVRFP
jgi:murein DD-endopeptidase MepM/ murein hydrolase activator NlpD